MFLFAAFGGFLSGIAPPGQTNPKFAVGLGSFLALLVLLIVSAVAKDSSAKIFKRRWMIAGIICFIVAVPLGFLYPWTLEKLTYPYPPSPDEPVEQHVSGFELTETAKKYIEMNPGNHSPGQLELKLPSDDIWTADSVLKAKMLLLANYIALVLAIATAIFCLLEANLKSGPRRGGRRPAKAQP